MCNVDDIIIERWLPYSPQPERRKIIERAPPPMKYPEPFHNITIYRNVETRTHQNFEHHVVQENPCNYKVLYKESLLDSKKLVQEATKAGVTENHLVNVFQTKIFRKKLRFFLCSLFRKNHVQ